jgi:sugar phosphate isomerase/epimerase
MKIGVCGGPGIAAEAARAGFDYFEWSVQTFLQPRAERADFLRALEQVRAAALPCEVCNCFLPGDLKVVGPQVDLAAVERYVTVACERAGEAGVKIIVFGSGGARMVPEGFDRGQAETQLAGFLRLVAPPAQRHGVAIAVEPLRRAECNIFNTVSECATAVRAAQSPAIRLLADSYHWAHNGETAADIVAAASLLRHMHVATQANRRAPGTEPCQALTAFLETVRSIDYRGGISFEGRLGDPAAELPLAAGILRP